MPESLYDRIISEIAESEISAHDFRVIDDILRKYVKDDTDNE